MIPPRKSRSNFNREARMAGPKIKVTFEINPDSYELLKQVRDRYKLPDTSKALRCLLDYAAADGDWDEIFAKVRCPRCP
jgi:hypothetical protein